MMNKMRRGQSVVEFALLLPVLSLLLLGAVDVGRIALTKVTIANASRAAAAYATNYQVLITQHGGNETTANTAVKQAAINEAAPGLALSTSDVTFTPAVSGTEWDPGARYTVRVATQFRSITPINILWGGGTLPLSHQTTLRHNCVAETTCSFPAVSCPALTITSLASSRDSDEATVQWTTSASAYGRLELRSASGTFTNGTYYLMGTHTSFMKTVSNVPSGTVMRIRVKDACGTTVFSNEYTL